MSESIRSISNNIPQIRRVDPKGSSGDRKHNKKGAKEFSEHLSIRDKDGKDKNQNKEKLDQESVDDHVKEDEDTLQTEKDYKLDDTCGTMIDTEI